MNFQTMSKQRKFVLIASAAGVISMFLPWISISVFGYTQSQNGMHDIGILAFLCFIVSAAISYLGDQTRNLDKNMWGIVLAAGALALLSVIWFYFKIDDSIMGTSLVGFGIYISAIAAIGVLASAYMFRSPSDSIKDSFSNLKKGLENKMGNPVNSNDRVITPEPPKDINPPL